MKSTSLLQVFAVVVFSSAIAAGCDGDRPLQAPFEVVEQAAVGEPVNLFVGFGTTPGNSERALVRSHGAVVREEFLEVAAFAIEMPRANMGALARAQGVLYVEDDPVRFPSSLATAELAPSLNNGLYGLVTTKSVDAHSRGVTGAGINVGVADTGLDYTHPDIAPVYKGGTDTVSNDSDPSWNNDPQETHGTHVAGTIVAATNAAGILGVAHGANLYHARVLGPAGGSSSNIMKGVRWLVETAKCKVVNLSLGGRFSSRTEENFYKEMRNKGALIVAASGNDGAGKLSYPAGYAANIAVGAVDRNNALASFSNRGRNLDVVAPGVTVLSSVPANQGSEASVTTSSSFTAFALEFAGSTSGVSANLVDCGLAKVGECPASVLGNVALIKRGDISFAEKVQNAMNAGALAAVIYNNVAGDFSGTLGSATASGGQPWIPAISVSAAAGAALLGETGTTANVVNQVSSWDHYDGTSMATPHVTGTVALIWSANPALNNSTVENYLFTSATNLGAAGYDTSYGHGIVNASAAVAKAGK